jgi:hypothetical protein
MPPSLPPSVFSISINEAHSLTHKNTHTNANIQVVYSMLASDSRPSTSRAEEYDSDVSIEEQSWARPASISEGQGLEN